jgi:hypothetical protein
VQGATHRHIGDTHWLQIMLAAESEDCSDTARTERTPLSHQGGGAEDWIRGCSLALGFLNHRDMLGLEPRPNGDSALWRRWLLRIKSL